MANRYRDDARSVVDRELQNDEYIEVIGSSSVSQNAASVSVEDGKKRRKVEGEGEACSSIGSQGNELNRSEVEGFSCSICMEAWTSEGDHHICCLPCGHIYGFSCIKKWLLQSRSSRKCPQCNMTCTMKDIRKLFTPRIAAVDGELHKIIRSLEAKCASLEKEGADWYKKEAEWKKRETELQLKVHELTARTTYLESLLGDRKSRPSGLAAAAWDRQKESVFGCSTSSKFRMQGASCSFIAQEELRVDGARLFDLDASNQILLLARRLSGSGGAHVLTKMSFIPPHETEDILLPPSTRAIKDLRVSPSNDGLALFASLGKKLSVLSMESNNIILAYDLPAAAWSCSWDLNSSHHIYAGLQNGSLLVFDMRQTMRPMESLNGLTNNPIHTIHSLLHNSTFPSGVRSLISGSSIGLCQWNFGTANERSFLVPETRNGGVCISSAYCPSSDDIVASYRPRVELSDQFAASQPLLSPSPVIGYGVQGSHIHFRRSSSNCYQKLGFACANVNSNLLPKTTIIDIENRRQLFASWDECSCEFILQELPSLTTVQRFKSAKYPIHDVKYACILNQGILGFLSEDTLQLFRMGLT